jgi:hypothetical protein
MNKQIFKMGVAFMLLCLIFPGASARADAIIAAHLASAAFEFIPEPYFGQVRATCNIFYGHTSHGSQIITGANVLETENSLYARPTFHEHFSDLGHNGDTSWVAPTRNWLDNNPDYNVVMWSWCGGCSDNTEAGINIYLDAMSQLEQDYPGVVFIYMTGHLDGTGPGGNLYARNNQIRAYCIDNNKVLFDFADIESYDPDGNYYPDGGDGCAWCYDWCVSHSCPSCACAHSHCFNCYLKGKTFWWMMARIGGWNPTQEINDNMPLANEVFISQNHPNPFNAYTTIEYTISEESKVKIEIFDVMGKVVEILVEEKHQPGDFRVIWDAGKFPSGAYFYKIQTRDYTETRKMILLK